MSGEKGVLASWKITATISFPVKKINKKKHSIYEKYLVMEK